MKVLHLGIAPLVCAVSFATTLGGCGGEDGKVRTAASPMPVEISEAKVTTTPDSASIAVSEDIARACNLHLGDVGKAPKFEFDKSDLLPADRDILSQIGQCVTTGPLQGRSLKVVGRADPRGTQEYNMALGGRRADSVGVFLNTLGVDRSRIHETSRGAFDATGSDEVTWQIDRRVDIALED